MVSPKLKDPEAKTSKQQLEWFSWERKGRGQDDVLGSLTLALASSSLLTFHWEELCSHRVRKESLAATALLLISRKSKRKDRAVPGYTIRQAAKNVLSILPSQCFPWAALGPQEGQNPRWEDEQASSLAGDALGILHRQILTIWDSSPLLMEPHTVTCWRHPKGDATVSLFFVCCLNISLQR